MMRKWTFALAIPFFPLKTHSIERRIKRKICNVQFVSKIFIMFLILNCYPYTANSQSIGHDCEPNGLIAKTKAVWNPKKFWTTQIKEIKEYVEAEKTTYRLSLIQTKRDRINEKLDDEEMKAMGIESFSDPELDREIAKIDREMRQFDRQMLNDAIEWGRKCTAYAKRKLSELEK
jgi:hypothetical protein